MTFQDSVRICLSKYADFNGRARRSEFWWFFLFTIIVSFVASILDTILGTDYAGSTSGGLINSLASLALLLPGLAVGARRLHDTGRSGWWQLLWIVICIGWIFLFVWWAQDSVGDNQHGASPKGIGAGGTPPPGPYGQPN
jgi:uncharacterized membrane protein YhaH (DUF805 family)